MSLVRAVVLIAALLVIGACTTTSKKTPEKIQTTREAEREDLPGAVGAPLRDLNVLRTKIPPVLLDAMAEPYRRPAELSCEALAALLSPLNSALDADLDQPAKTKADLLGKGRSAALGAVANATSGAVPFRGWVRKLSGAERHDSYVQAAITAGAVRRAYLKGLGDALSCAPPAAPVRDQEFRPGYPPTLPTASEPPAGNSPVASPQSPS